MKLCVKGFPNRLRNGREKRENTHTQTHTHFRIYISSDVSKYIDTYCADVKQFSPEINGTLPRPLRPSPEPQLLYQEQLLLPPRPSLYGEGIRKMSE